MSSSLPPFAAKEVNHDGLSYIVTFKSSATTSSELLSRVSTNATRVKRTSKIPFPKAESIHNFNRAMKGVSLRMNESQINEWYDLIQNDTNVQSIEPDIGVKAFAQTVPWGISRIGTVASTIAKVNGIVTDGQSPSPHIFILDTGVSPHPDLTIATNDIKSFVIGDKSPSIDGNGHGTAVAGVAAARDNVDGVVGVCPGAIIHSYKCLDSTGSGRLSDIIAAVEAVMTYKALNPTHRCLVNMSLGGYTGSTVATALDNAVSACVAAGIPVIVAAGNDGDNAAFYTPAHATAAITVGAYDSANNMTSWSNYGSNVDIMAPGASIQTTAYFPNAKGRNTKFGYTTYHGTSFSCPHVAGAVALYMHLNPSHTPVQIRDGLLALANDIGNPAIVTNLDTINKSVYVATIDYP